MDVFIRDDANAILFVVKVDTHSRGFDPEPRLISDATDVFHNDEMMPVKRLSTEPDSRRSQLGSPPLADVITAFFATSRKEFTFPFRIATHL